MNLKIDVQEHFYTTDFYQVSAFSEEHQIISIYYFVKALEQFKVSIKKTPFDFDESQKAKILLDNYAQSFRFIDSLDFNENCMTLPIDKVVANMIVKI